MISSLLLLLTLCPIPNSFFISRFFFLIFLVFFLSCPYGNRHVSLYSLFFYLNLSFYKFVPPPLFLFACLSFCFSLPRSLPSPLSFRHPLSLLSLFHPLSLSRPLNPSSLPLFLLLSPPPPLPGHHPVFITNFITSDVMYDVQSILLYDPTWRCTVYCAVLYAHLKNKEAFSYLGRKFFCLDSCTRTMKAEIPTRVRQ